MYRRRRKIAKPRLQWKLISTIAGLVLLGLMLQHLVYLRELAQLAEGLPHDGERVLEKAPGLGLLAILQTVGLILPLTVLVGAVSTFRLAGPIYRFEKHLGAIARGEDPGPCRIRNGDELTELCDAINGAVKTLRAQQRAAVAPQVDFDLQDLESTTRPAGRRPVPTGS